MKLNKILKNQMVQTLVIFLLGILLRQVLPFSHEGLIREEEFNILKEERDAIKLEREIVKSERDSARVKVEALKVGIIRIDNELKGILDETEKTSTAINSVRTHTDLLHIFSELDSLAGN
jgi:hypothetical protein